MEEAEEVANAFGFSSPDCSNFFSDFQAKAAKKNNDAKIDEY